MTDSNADRATASSPTAVVTGAGSGIGRAIACELVGIGYRVAALGRHIESLRETRDACVTPQQVEVVQADVTDPDQIGAAFDRIRSAWGRLDLLVNNAGVFGPAVPLELVTAVDWDEVLAVNVSGAFACTQHAVALMKEQTPRGGRLINIGSVSAYRPRMNNVAYAVSKHALTGLSRSTALEGRDHQITCTQVDIGNARTAMNQAATTGPTSSPAPESSGEATFDVAHVAALICAIAVLPTSVTVTDLSVFATEMPLLGRA